jgi:hypothetical protein
MILTFLSEGWQRDAKIHNTQCDYVEEEDPDEVEPAIRLRKPLLIRRGRITFVNVHFLILYTFHGIGLSELFDHRCAVHTPKRELKPPVTIRDETPVRRLGCDRRKGTAGSGHGEEGWAEGWHHVAVEQTQHFETKVNNHGRFSSLAGVPWRFELPS